MRFKTTNNEYISEGELGSGGNAVVYQVKDQSDNKHALKILQNKFFPSKGSSPGGKNAIKVQRFLQEIEIMNKIKNENEGILKISDSYIPERPNIKDIPFYVMPIATTVDKQLEGQEIEDKIIALKKITETLMKLHEQNIAHRDIKPENLYFYQESYFFGDFGLATNIEDVGLTGPKEKMIGPWTTIAPEMRRNPQNADPFQADIYSLSKTIWILLTENWKGFDGPYNFNDQEISLETCVEADMYWSILHDLLHKATSNSPSERPNIQEFYVKYCEWMQIQEDLELASKFEWEFLLREISDSTASSLTWRDTNEIANVLKKVSAIKSMNHTFLPQGGGADLINCSNSDRVGFVELNLDGLITLIKPKALHLEKFEDVQWNYFYIESEIIDSNEFCEEPTNTSRYYEEVLDVPNECFLNLKYAYYQEYNGEPLPEETRKITLGLEGNYVLFSKMSYYNKISSSYEAFQTEFEGPSKFRDFVIALKERREWVLKNPEENQRLQARKEIKEKAKKQREREKYLDKFEEEKSKLLDDLENHSLSDRFSPTDENEALNYYFDIQFDTLGELSFYLDKNLELKQKSDSFSDMSLERVMQDDYYSYSYYLFQNAHDAARIESIMHDIFSTYLSANEIINDFNIGIELKRQKQPSHLFSLQELKEAMFEADETIANRLVVNQHGKVKLVPHTEEIKWFPFIGESFAPYTEIIGSYAKDAEDVFKDIYALTLKGWHNHLISGKRKSVPDYIHPQSISPESIRELILEESKNYSE